MAQTLHNVRVVLNKLLAVAATLAVLCPASIAFGQDQQEQEDKPPGRFRLGSSVSVTPAMVIVVGRDSNALRTSTGTPAGEVYTVPQMETWIGRGIARLNFANAVEFARQKREGDVMRTITNQYHFVRATVGGRRADVSGQASYRDHYAPPTDFVGFAFGIKSRRIERTAGLDFGLKPGGRLSYVGRYSTAQLRYDRDAFFQGASLEKNLNRNLTNFGGEAQLALTPMSSAVFSAFGFRDRFLFAPDRDGNGMYFLAGFAFSPRALFTGHVQAGYLGYTVLKTATRYGAPGYNVGLSYARPALLLDLTGQRAVEYSFDPGQGFYLSNSIEGLAILRLSSKWELFERSSLRHLTPQGNLALNESARDVIFHKGGLARKFSAATKIGVDAEWYKNGGGGGFSGLRTTIFFTYGSTRLLRLDRPLPGGF